MEQDKNHKRQCSVFKRIKYFFTSQEKLEAHLLDYMQEHPELTPPPPAPPGNEFEKIMTELDRRGSKIVLRNQLKLLHYGGRIGSFMHKPAVLFLAVVIFLGCTSAGASADKAFDYEVKGKMVRKSSFALNSDQYVIKKTDELKEAYTEIEERLGIHALKLAQMPAGMKLYELGLEDRSVTMKLFYNGETLYFIQANYPVSASGSAALEKSNGKTVQNSSIGQEFVIQKNDLEDGTTEYCTSIAIDGAFYYLAGFISEQEFVSIIESLKFEIK